MSSLVIYADRALKNIDSDCMAVADGALTPLTTDTIYSVQNTGHNAQGDTHTIGGHHYAYLVQLSAEPATPAALRRALAAAAVLKPFDEATAYSVKTSKVGYVWSPHGEVSVSVNENP